MSRHPPRREPQLRKVRKTVKAIERKLNEHQGDPARLGAVRRSLEVAVAGSLAGPSPRDGRPLLRISGAALATLAWAARRSPGPCGLRGVLELTGEGQLRLAEAILATPQGAPAWGAPCRTWHGDLPAELQAERSLEPWQLACWIQTHPLGLGAPSVAERAAFAARFGRQRLALMLIVTAALKFFGELSVFQAPLPAAAPVRLASPLGFTFEEPAASLDDSAVERLERQYQALVPAAASRALPTPWPWDAPTELWPEGDPDFHPPDEPYLPAAWIKAWRQARLDLPEAELEDYLRSFLWRGGRGREELTPAAWDLDEIALYFDSEQMSVWAAALLRERLREVARRQGWWPAPGDAPAPDSPP